MAPKSSVVMCTLAFATAAISRSIPSRRSLEHPAPEFAWQNIKSVLAFGDDYTYVQGTLGQPGASFIGNASTLAYTTDQLLSNRIVHDNSSLSKGGPNWVEYLTGCGLAPGLTDPRTCDVQLWDFAYAGADVGSQYSPLRDDQTVHLDRQVQQLKQYGDPALADVMANKNDTLVALWIGTNDVLDLYESHGKDPDLSWLYDTIHYQALNQIEEIYLDSYRNFVIFNIPPLDRAPSAIVDARLVTMWNSNWKSAVEGAFQYPVEGANMIFFDVNALLNDVLDNYERYELQSAADFWLDSKRVTTKVHKIIADALKTQLLAFKTDNEH